MLSTFAPETGYEIFKLGGVLSILNTLFLAVVTIKLPFFGNYSIGFFKGISELADFSKEAKNARFILMFSGILFLALAGLLIYSSFSKNKNLLKYSIFGNIAFLVIFYIVLYVKLPGGEASKYISVSYFKILIYIISLGLAYLTYRALEKKDEKKDIYLLVMCKVDSTGQILSAHIINSQNLKEELQYIYTISLAIEEKLVAKFMYDLLRSKNSVKTLYYHGTFPYRNNRKRLKIS